MRQEKELCNNLKSVRIGLGMSQQDLAKLAGVTRQTISGVESGQCAPSVSISSQTELITKMSTKYVRLK